MERIIEAHELDVYRNRFKHILDVRSPGEFEEDHMPGAINVPMLNNAQRAEVGTLYKQNPFEARKLGAVYALEAIQRFMQSSIMLNASKSDGFLIYCARGGQRSGSISLVLSQVGLAVFRLQRGYKSWRSYVNHLLSSRLPGPVYVLQGYTGSWKTRILMALKDRVNILDLEGCALHRGSLLGDLPGRTQPGQRAFETSLAESIRQMNPNLPTLIEGESRKIGRCAIPKPLWDQMTAANHLWLEIPRSVRVGFILADYHDLKNTEYLSNRLKRLARYLPNKISAELAQHMEMGEWESFVDKLLAHHYDPLYGKSRKNREPIQADTFQQAVDRVARRICLASAPT